MPGRPIMKANNDKLDKLGEDQLFDQLAAGSTTNALVASIGVGKRSFYSWLRNEEGRMERYYAARKQWADYLAEETLSIADSAVDASDAQVAKLRIETRKWLAGQANPDNWAARREALVNINIQDQHLKALRDIVSEQ